MGARLRAYCGRTLVNADADALVEQGLTLVQDNGDSVVAIPAEGLGPVLKPYRASTDREPTLLCRQVVPSYHVKRSATVDQVGTTTWCV